MSFTNFSTMMDKVKRDEPWELICKKVAPIKNAIIQPYNFALIHKTTSLFRYSANFVNKEFKIHPEKHIFGGLRVFAIGMTPLAIHNIAISTFSLLKSTLNEKIDAILNIVSEIGTLGDAVGTFTEGLESFGITVTQAAVWAAPLVFVGIGLQFAGLVLKVKEFIETYYFAKLFTEVTEFNEKASSCELQAFLSGIALIESSHLKEKSCIGKYFGVDDHLLADKLVKIEIKSRAKLSSSNPKEIGEAKQILQTTLISLRHSLKIKNLSRSLTILATIVSVVGLAVLFASPIAPLGYGLLAVSTAVVLGAFIFNNIKTHEFENQLLVLGN